MRAEELKGYLDALLLAALEDGSRHGYTVIEALRESTGGRRRSYRPTAAGGRALPGKRADWRDFAAIMGAALEGRPWPSPA